MDGWHLTLVPEIRDEVRRHLEDWWAYTALACLRMASRRDRDEGRDYERAASSHKRAKAYKENPGCDGVLFVTVLFTAIAYRRREYALLDFARDTWPDVRATFKKRHPGRAACVWDDDEDAQTGPRVMLTHHEVATNVVLPDCDDDDDI